MTRVTKPGHLPTSVRFLIPGLLFLSLQSCDIFAGLAAPEASDTALVRFVEPVNGEVELSLSAADTGRSAYVVFTTGVNDNLGAPGATATSVAREVAPALTPPDDRNQGLAEKASEVRRRGMREALASAPPFVARSLAISGGNPSGDIVGNAGSFILWGDATGVTSTCRLVETNVDFGGRVRSLSIWVQDTQWSPVDGVDGKVSPNKILALADAFFGVAGSRGNSIYAWVTNMLGDEWGVHSGSITYGVSTYALISQSDNVTIFLADIDNDGSAFTSNGGVVGYFYPGDTIPAFQYSNERVMFTIDSVMLGTADNGTWETSDYWPSTVLSTLAHEFQHMIHFYQKGVLRGGDYFSEPTWIDELCSMQVEDLLADKMGVPGPRGITPSDGTAGSPANQDGRLPMYLYYPELSPVGWDSASNDMLLFYYSWAYSFGAYLTRNYGGADFIRQVVQTPDAGVGAVTAAAASFSGRDETMESLLRRWGAAVLLSARTDAPEYYRYNTGGFESSTVGTTAYRLGSINMYNYALGIDANGDDTVDYYVDEPYVFTSETIGSQYVGGAYSNAFMHLGTPSDNPSWTLTVPDGMYATIVID